MPEPPEVGLLTRFVLENPWPVAVVLLAGALISAWIGLREGRRDRLRLAALPAVVGAAVLLTGFLVTTSGERARQITRELVDAAVAGDVSSAMTLIADDALLSIGSPNNPGFEADYVRSRLEALDRRVAIESNRITTLEAYTESSETATVHLKCLTVVRGYRAPSEWVLRISRQPDGTWKVDRITCISINGQTPSSELF